MYLVCILQPNSADRIRPARLFAGSGAAISLVPSNYNCWRISVKQQWLLIRKRRQWNEENIVLNPDARPSYGLSTFNGNSARVGEEAAHWFLLCCQHRGVNAFFFFFIFFPWLTTDGVTQGGDGGIHTLLFIDLLYENVFFFFLLFRLRLEHLQPTTPESWDLSSQTFFMIIRMLRLGAFEKKNDTAENK